MKLRHRDHDKAGDNWTKKAIQEWISSEEWYQSIPIMEDLVTPGSTDSTTRMELLDLGDLSGKSVLDIGCNSGMYCFECKRRLAARVVGIDTREDRLRQARTLAEIMRLDVEFLQMNLLEAGDRRPFDMVLCFAVLTEITDVLQALLTLKKLARETIYLELAVFGLGRGDFRLPFRPFGSRLLHLITPWSTARLRRTKKGWSLAPSVRLLEEVMGDEFEIIDLGQSLRYRLFKLVRKSAPSTDGSTIVRTN